MALYQPPELVTVFVDGAAEPNPGPGGWAAILLVIREGKLHWKEFAGYVPPPMTNNQMELFAIYMALFMIVNKQGEKADNIDVIIYSDSQWSVNCISLLWDAKKNLQLINKIWELQEKLHKVEYCWIRGHGDNRWNNRADALAVQAVNEKKEIPTLVYSIDLPENFKFI
jgi:ribonuclease HI